MTAIRSINLVLRFVLELAGLAAVGYWGFTRFDPWLARIACGVGLPLVMAAAWGIFRVPNDGGAPVVEVPGLPGWATAFAAILVVHYGVDHQRTFALLAGRPLL